MGRFARSWLGIGVGALWCFVLAGCSTNGDVQTIKSAARPHVTMDATVVVQDCGSSITPPGIRTATCAYVDAFTRQTITSLFHLTGLLPGDLVAARPVIIIQVPADATHFVGTYDNGRGGTGPLLFAPDNTVLPLDATTSLVAEPGMELVVVQLPPATPSDTYFMVLSYDASTTQIKGLSALGVTASGSTYYPTALPCTASMTSVPEIPIPQTPIETRIDVRPIASAFVPCNGKTYDFTSAPQVPVTVVEYSNASLDHYFITWHADEIAILDAGVQIRGWVRTGKTFKAYGGPVNGGSPVCRFYIPPAYGDSHFFGRGQQECDETASKFPQFTNEDGHFMYVFLPVAGVCPAGTVAVHRAFSNRADANHRYFTDPAIGAQMAAQHWLLEGDGPDLVVMCAV